MSETTVAQKTAKPEIFDYVDFRLFLKDMYQFKKTRNPSFSENAFIYAAGFGKNSRGYLGLIIKNKRNLTLKSIQGFSQAMDLNPEEATYFENMVLFNQAENDKEKVQYFEKMKVSVKGKDVKLFHMQERQLRYFNEWHVSIMHSILGTIEFREDVDWIYERLGKKVSKEKILEGIDDLIGMGLAGRDENGKLITLEGNVWFAASSTTFQNGRILQKSFLNRMHDALDDKPFEERMSRLLTMCVSIDRFDELRNEIQLISQQLMTKYGTGSNRNDVVQVGFQLLKVTEPGGK